MSANLMLWSPNLIREMNVHLHCVRADISHRHFKRLIRFQFNYRKEMAQRSLIVALPSTHSNSNVERKTISGRFFDGGSGFPFAPVRQRPVDPGAHEFLLKAAISLSPNKSWWVIRRHQSRCQRRPRRGPHRLPIHKSGAHVPWHTHTCMRRTCTYTGDMRERDRRISSDFSTPDREPVVMLN